MNWRSVRTPPSPPFEGEWVSRLVFSGSYWHRKSQDVYQNAQVAPSTGYATRLDNLSTIVSHGIDLSLDALSDTQKEEFVFLLTLINKYHNLLS